MSAMKPEIILLYDADCPNASPARAALREALWRAGIEPRWVEYDRAALGTPKGFLRYGSPTILVDGTDIAGERGEPVAAACRVYPDAHGFRGVPPVETILVAIMDRRGVASRTREVR
jgi:hypothetical protein